MKTIKNIVAQPTTNTFDELVFTNRNRAYGAYELRKEYKKRLFIGFLFAFFIFGTGISVPLIESFLHKVLPRPEVPVEVTATLENIKDDFKVPEIPDPVVPAIERFAPITIVDTLLTDDAGMLSMDDAVASIGNDEPEPDIIAENTTQSTPEIDESETELVFVTEPAQFEGGSINDFRIWVQRNVAYPQSAIDAGLFGNVNLTFCINSKGDICNIQVVRGVHPLLDNEAIRVLMNSPRWTPAKQNGKVVKQRFQMPVMYRLQ